VAQPKLTLAQAKATLKAINDAGGDRTAAANKLNIPRTTLSDRIRIIAGTYPELPRPTEATSKPKRVLTLAEEVEATREASKAVQLDRRLREAKAEIAALQDRIKNLEWADNVSAKPADWTLDTRVQRGKSPHIPLLFFSDAQAGEVIRGDETDTPWDYDSNIFRQRYRKMIGVTCDLSQNHAGTSWVYPGIVYCRGGDNISGGLHEDLRELGEDATAVQQSELVFEEEARGIQILAEVFGRVDVKSVPGNHDRTTHKPMTKLAWARSFDHLIHKMLTQEFKRDKRVTFQTSRSPDIRFPIFDKNMFMSHGDKMGSRGGMGFVGPGATILRGWQKLAMEQAALGYHVDMTLTGHLHYPMALLIGIANGSFTGTSEFGKMHRMAPQPPLQHLAYFHPKHGMVDVRPIYLAD
jgi:hypothetical protein